MITYQHTTDLTTDLTNHKSTQVTS